MMNYIFNVFPGVFLAQRRAARPRKNQKSTKRGSPDMCAAHERTARARHDDNNAHMGPIPLRAGGTLTAQDRDDIYARTGVSCSVRFRPQWQERCLSLSGPSQWLSEARRLADERIAANGQDGGRRPSPEELAANLTALRHEMDRNNQWYMHQIGQINHGLQQLTTNAQQLSDLQVQMNQLAAAVAAGVQTANEARQVAERRDCKSPRQTKQDAAKRLQQRDDGQEPEKKMKNNASETPPAKMTKEEASSSSASTPTSADTKGLKGHQAEENNEGKTVKTEETEGKSDLAKPVGPTSPTSPARSHTAERVTGLHFLTCCSLFCNYAKLVSQVYTSCVFHCLCLLNDQTLFLLMCFQIAGPNAWLKYMYDQFSPLRMTTSPMLAV